jgi:hypothetical protein
MIKEKQTRHGLLEIILVTPLQAGYVKLKEQSRKHGKL